MSNTLSFTEAEMGKKTSLLATKITPELEEDLELAAQLDGLTVSQAVRRCLKEYVEKQKQRAIVSQKLAERWVNGVNAVNEQDE